jgi:hypothetical protein
MGVNDIRRFALEQLRYLPRYPDDVFPAAEIEAKRRPPLCVGAVEKVTSGLRYDGGFNAPCCHPGAQCFYDDWTSSGISVGHNMNYAHSSRPVLVAHRVRRNSIEYMIHIEQRDARWKLR